MDGTYLDAVSQAPPTPSGTGAKRQVTFLEQWKHCEGFFRTKSLDPQLEECMRVAGRLLEEGIRWQEQRWQSRRAQHGVVLAAFEELRKHLGSAPAREFEGVAREVNDVRRQASRLVALEKGQFSLVSQGGVSYGAWQAGFALFLTNWVHRVRDYQRQLAAPNPLPTPGEPVFSGFSSVTGASAGAVNGLAVALAGCRTHSRERPAESLFYKVWVDSLGLFGRHERPGLFPTSGTERRPLAIFDERALAVAMEHAKQEMAAAHFIPNCSSDLGFAVTHLDAKARTVHIDEQKRPVIVRSSLREKFVVRLQSGQGGALSARNLEPGPSRAFYAGLGWGKEVELQTLRDAVRASGAFPVAFPPVEKLRYTQHGLDTSKQVEGTFVDGGTFDNTPIGVAIDLNRWQAESVADRQQGNPYLRELLDEAPTTYYFLEPNVTPWALEQAAPTAKSGPPRDVLAAFGAFAGDFVSSSFDAEFLDNARANPFVLYAKRDWVGPRLSVPMRHMPIAGEQLAHFNAFLEHDFRDFDFYAGMADAYEFVKKEETVFKLSGFTLDSAAKVRSEYEADDPRYACISQYYDALITDHAQLSDDSPRLEAITRFAQLPSRCRALTVLGTERTPGGAVADDDVKGYLARVKRSLAAGEDKAAAHGADRQHAVARHNFLTALVAMHNYHGWLRTAGKGVHSPEKFYQALAGHSFEQEGLRQPDEPSVSGLLSSPAFYYVDMEREAYVDELQPEPGDVWRAVRWLGHNGINHLARSQDSAVTANTLRLASRPALDSLFDVKLLPKNTLGFGVGHSLEAFYGRRIYYRLRGDMGGRFLHLSRSMFQHPEVKEDFLAGELYARLLVHDLFPTLPVELDTFAGYSAGYINGTQEWAHGPLLGLRATLIGRLSLALEGKLRSTFNAVPDGHEQWLQLNTYLTWQVFF